MKNKKLIIGLSALSVTAFVIVYHFMFSFSSLNVEKEGKEGKKIKGALKYYSSILTNQNTGVVDIADVAKARKEVIDHRAKTSSSKSSDISWSHIGPTNIGGRTRSVLVDKTNTSIMYAGGVCGGLWKSTNSGSSWQRDNSISDVLSISCIGQDNSGGIYVGTGEGLTGGDGTILGTAGFMGNGVYYKSSSASSFTHIASTAVTSNVNTHTWAFVNKIKCCPSTGRVYVATHKGLFYTTDQGATWTNPVRYPIPTQTYYGSAIDVEIGTDGTVHTIMGGGTSWRYFKGKDDFTQYKGGELPSMSVARIELAVAPSDPNYIYASVASGVSAIYGELDNIYRSTNKGENWSIIGAGGSVVFQPFRDQGAYDNEIVVFPDNKNKILLGGINLWTWEQGKTWTQISDNSADNDDNLSNDIYWVHSDHHTYTFHPNYPDGNYDIFIGSDGGVFGGNMYTSDYTNKEYWEFSAKNINYSTMQLYTMSISRSGEVMGGTQDNGTMFMNRVKSSNIVPSETYAYEVRGGDGGECAFSLINPDMIFTSIYYGSITRHEDKLDPDPTKETFYMDTMVNIYGDDVVPGGDGFPSDFVTPFAWWENVRDDNGVDSVDFTANKDYSAGDSVCLLSNTQEYLFKNALHKAVDSGQTIKVQDRVTTRFFAGYDDLNGYPSRIWMTKRALEFSSVPEWYLIAELGFSFNIRNMEISKDGNHLFVTERRGNRLYRISNILATRDSLNSDIRSDSCVVVTTNIAPSAVSSNRAITEIVIDPTDANNVMLTLGNYGNTKYVYYSTNALGTNPTFANKQGDLPAMPVYSGLIEMGGDNVFVGTEYGVYATADIDVLIPEWFEVNTGMEKLPVTKMKQQVFDYPNVSNFGHIYVGTHGRGFFECLDFAEVNIWEDYKVVSVKELASTTIAMNVYPNPVSTYLNVSFELKEKSDVMIKVYDLTGKCVKNIKINERVKGLYNEELDLSSLNIGTYIVQIIAGEHQAHSKIIVTK